MPRARMAGRGRCGSSARTARHNVAVGPDWASAAGVSATQRRGQVLVVGASEGPCDGRSDVLHHIFRFRASMNRTSPRYGQAALQAISFHLPSDNLVNYYHLLNHILRPTLYQIPLSPLLCRLQIREAGVIQPHAWIFAWLSLLHEPPQDALSLPPLWVASSVYQGQLSASYSYNPLPPCHHCKLHLGSQRCKVTNAIVTRFPYSFG